jgi:hypothetical protein
MNDSQQFDADRRASTILGLRYGRIAGHVLTLLLLTLGLSALIKGSGIFEAFKGVYFITYSIVISLPFTRLSDKSWSWGFGLLVGLSALFVFLMVVVVIFAYMASDARGERLGVPGFEGTLIFLALLQVPVVLFQRKPDMLD